ncbi:glycosyltransferase family 1 protein, partial [bacterium]
IHRKNGYIQCPTRYFHLEDYASKCGDFTLIEAGFVKPSYWNEYGFSSEELAKIRSKPVALLEFEEPNKYLVGDYPEAYSKDFSKIYTICPYTSELLNKKYNEKRRIPIFFPVHERYIRPIQKKTIDIIYSGHILAGELRNELKYLANFNYAIISNSKDSLVTHRSVSYEEKMRLYSHSKITLVHNIIFKPYLHRIMNIWLAGDYWNNKAFSQVPSPWRFWQLFTKNIHIPQLKSRVFEAAMSHSLILCRKDEFNVIERYFEPNKEFKYYEQGQLQETVNHVLSQYDDYKTIVERAYKRAIKEYTVSVFVKKYLKDIPRE